ncbi:MAG: sugar ABC transporter substrate-binding protein [Acetobacteraceae bacterium]|nr:sugar ABC transporter substrate-binding protein [Acetobacteraceae bacterium]
MESTGRSLENAGRREVLKAAAAGLALPLLDGASAHAAADPVTITLWSWLPRFQPEVDAFEKANPNIKVQLINAGQGLAEYVKLRNALKAGTGAPDVVQVEFYMVRSFREVHGLTDIAAYVSKNRDDYVPWAWAQVSEGNQVYALPWDSGPMGLIYRKDIFDAHQIEPPATWDAFAEAALKLHKDAPDVFLTDAMFTDGGWCTGIFWQAGWRPFDVKGDTITIRINDDAAKKTCAFWQKLLDAKAVDTGAAFTTEWYESFDRGRYATWISAAWGPVFLTQFAKSSSGKWRAAAMPQWQPGGHVSSNWGGSTLAVTKQSKHPKEAVTLISWMLARPQEAEVFSSNQFLFPTLKAVLDSPQFLDKPFPFYGGQQINKIFAASAKEVDASFQWSPFQDYVNNQLGNELGAAAAGHGTLLQALDRVQRNISQYAKQEGFTVKT